MSTRHANPISRRYESLLTEWMGFRKNKETRLTIWQVSDDEIPMVERFINQEASEHGRSPDLFIALERPFHQPESYAKHIVDEMKEQLEAYQEAVPQNDQVPAWQVIHKKEKGFEQSPQMFIRNLEDFSRSIKDFEELTVAYLSPSEILDPEHWEKWLIQALGSGIAENIRLLVLEVIDPALEKGQSKTFRQLVQNYSEKVKLFRADLNMHGAMREAAAQGDPNHPGVRFQTLYLDLGQAAGRKQINRVERLSQEALVIAQREDWPHLQVAVHSLVASAWLSKNNPRKAIESYESACQIAENTYKGPPKPWGTLGGKLWIQSLFASASAKLLLPNYQTALADYEKICPLAEAQEDYFSHLEARRMAGYCHRLLGHRTQSWDNNLQALAVAEQYSELIRQGATQEEARAKPELRLALQRGLATLAFVGQALLKLIPSQGNHQDEVQIRQRLEILLGQDWESSLHQYQNLNPKEV